MEMPNPDIQAPAVPEPPAEAAKQVPKERPAAPTRVASVIVSAVVAVVDAL